jgi:hypothetical protein
MVQHQRKAEIGTLFEEATREAVPLVHGGMSICKLARIKGLKYPIVPIYTLEENA